MPGGHGRRPQPRQHRGSRRLHRDLQRIRRELLPRPEAIRQRGHRPDRLRRCRLHARVRCARNVDAAVHHLVVARQRHVPRLPHHRQHREIPRARRRGSVRRGRHARTWRAARSRHRSRVLRGCADGRRRIELLPRPARDLSRHHSPLARYLALRDGGGRARRARRRPSIFLTGRTLPLRTAIAALMTMILILVGGWVAHAQASYEAEPVLNAKDLATPDLLRGPHFTVDPKVPVKGFLERFTIRSTYGTFQANGLRMLPIRVNEVEAIAKLDDLSKTKEFADAAGRAIARPVTSTVNMLVHPVETITGFPDGVARLFDRIELGSERVYQAATAPGQSGGERAQEASKRVGMATITALGFEKERRDLAKSLGVDPYTTNPVLSEKLTNAAWVAFSGRMVIQTATSILVPYSMAMSAVTITNSSIYDTPAADLINADTAIFNETGASEQQVRALMQNPQYPLSVLTDLALAIRRLQGVPGRDAVVIFAAAARTQVETRFMAGAVGMLARYHEAVAPIVQISAPGPILGRTEAGALVVPMPVDYIAWTERVAHFPQRPDIQAPEHVGFISGRLSPRAEKEFTKRGWKLWESFTIAAER